MILIVVGDKFINYSDATCCNCRGYCQIIKPMKDINSKL